MNRCVFVAASCSAGRIGKTGVLAEALAADIAGTMRFNRCGIGWRKDSKDTWTGADHWEGDGRVLWMQQWREGAEGGASGAERRNGRRWNGKRETRNMRRKETWRRGRRVQLREIFGESAADWGGGTGRRGAGADGRVVDAGSRRLVEICARAYADL